jgi:drug/metabolite transporter (DMT)-like permease
MLEPILGVLAATGAATFYSLGVALQALDARQTQSNEYLRPGLMRRLIKQSRWLFGTGLSILGWPLQLLALALAPLILVQPAMASGLLVLLVAGEHLLGERAGRREQVAVGAIVLGVIGAALCAPPNTTSHAPYAVLTLVLGGLALASLLPYIMLSLFHRPSTGITMVGAGLAFGWSGVATKLVVDDLQRGRFGFAIVWAIATGVASVIAALSEMSALQSRPAIQVAPVVFVIQTAVPVILAPVLLEERFTETPLNGAPLAVSLAVLIVGAVVLARSPLLVALLEAEHAPAPGDQTGRGPTEPVSTESGSAESRSASSRTTMRAMPDEDAVEEPEASTTRTSPARTARR